MQGSVEAQIFNSPNVSW